MRRIVTAHNKRTLPRYVLCILPPSRNLTPANRRVQSVIRLTNSMVGEMLRESIEKLSVITDQVYPNINLDMQVLHGDNPEIEECITDNKVQSPNQYRACVFTVEVTDNASPALRENLGISHLVAVQIVGRDRGWSALGGMSSAKVEISIQKLPYLLHDIALDIAMFHSWPFLVNQFGGSVGQGIQFSQMKSRFAKQVGLRSFYGPITDENLEYFTLAAYCRRTGNFDYVAYEALWKKFLRDLILGESGSADGIPQTSVDAIQYIFKNHEYRGQLSREKISREISGLEGGTYLLLLTHNKPKSRKVRAHIAVVFGRRSFKLGVWKVVPFSEYEKYAREYPYVTFFKFTVPQ